jgi:hypothetical protein
VSAFELEALPRPPPQKLAAIDALIRHHVTPAMIDARIRALYFGEA